MCIYCLMSTFLIVLFSSFSAKPSVVEVFTFSSKTRLLVWCSLKVAAKWADFLLSHTASTENFKLSIELFSGISLSLWLINTYGLGSVTQNYEYGSSRPMKYGSSRIRIRNTEMKLKGEQIPVIEKGKIKGEHWVSSFIEELPSVEWLKN